ncbi:hypothetical protein HK101_003382 [Irineochytrium annulatum]|nr:hypothetical protein HK101_003382 [Irineochytrium annulatum]
MEVCVETILFGSVLAVPDPQCQPGSVCCANMQGCVPPGTSCPTVPILPAVGNVFMSGGVGVVAGRMEVGVMNALFYWSLAALPWINRPHPTLASRIHLPAMAALHNGKKMKMNFLGRSGTKVSEIALGCMTFGEGVWSIPTESDEAAVFEMLDRYHAKGGNFIDTADVYGRGASEVVLGKWIKKIGDRDGIVIATKGFGAMGEGENQMGATRRHLTKALEESLQRLGTDYIDLYQMHGWDAATPLKETLSTLDDFVRSGKVRYLGASNYAAWHLQKACSLSDHHNLEKFVTLQQQYSLLERNYELDLAEVCSLEGIGCLPWSPLKGGLLSGKYRRDVAAPAGSRLDWADKVGWKETSYKQHDRDHTWSTVDAVTEIAKKKGVPVSAVSLRWLMQMPTVTAPIIGARTIQQLDENLIACDFELSKEEMALLSQASKNEAPYPYSVINSQGSRYGRIRL